jgi:hypothetical protein
MPEHVLADGAEPLDKLFGLVRRWNSDHGCPAHLKLGKARWWLRCWTATTTPSATARSCRPTTIRRQGFAGKEFKQVMEAMGLPLLRPDRKDQTYRNIYLQAECASGSSPQSRPLTPSRGFHPSRPTPTGVAAGIWHTTGPPASPVNDHVYDH